MSNENLTFEPFPGMHRKGTVGKIFIVWKIRRSTLTFFHDGFICTLLKALLPRVDRIGIKVC